MINNREVERAVLTGLTAWLQPRYDKHVELVRANQPSPIPAYPYIAYTVVTPLAQKGGTFSKAPDGTFYKPAAQTWSIVVNSDDHDEAQTVAQLCHDFLAQAGSTYLGDAGIVVSTVGDITNRDNFITIEYEKRQGFDFTLALVNHVETTRAEMSGVIETVVWPQENIGG
ncbi:hypothetical protein LJC49_04495 [Ruminococcaceae bacterium OttesenSCG-928-I18]|nr:hypothetical protein [Ruminococcaceae bacterium OttesenSCG-928-I18]